MGDVVRFMRGLVAGGMPWETAAIAADVYEDMTGFDPSGAATSAPGTPGRPVFVYVVAEDGGYVKVGISESTITRIAVISTSNPRKCWLAHEEGPFVRSDALAIESAAHALLSPHRVRGEWFDCSIDMAVAAVASAAERA